MALDSEKLLDDIGWHILKELNENARISFAELGRTSWAFSSGGHGARAKNGGFRNHPWLSHRTEYVEGRSADNSVHAAEHGR